MSDAEDAEEDVVQAPQQTITRNLPSEKELDEKYPNRPHNHSKTLPFYELYSSLFNPLRDNQKRPTGPVTARRKLGPSGAKQSPQDARKNIIQRFIARWRKEVGPDIFPAFRLIVPDKDRERPMYGLKEKIIGKLLVRIIRIDKDSEDAHNLLNWKLPGKSTSAMAGDFAGRCYEVLSKRAMRTKPGDMTVEEVNQKLDALALAQKEEHQLPIMEEFYRRMNAEEMMWLIRMILRQMKIGATERTIFENWHPDAETLFNISSNLRRVCWELHDPDIRLEPDDSDITLMQCFQPQLAQFQMHSIDRIVQKMQANVRYSGGGEDGMFWVEEKLDGERMQLHMMEDEDQKGGKRFRFWSRKAKDYTYLYGDGFYDEKGSLSRHLKEAFDKRIRNVILDGEMITWDPEADKIVGFGSLKSAAIAEQRNPYIQNNRPLFRVFDILYLNDQPLTKWTLLDRRRALEESVRGVERRLEIHPFQETSTAAKVEEQLHQVVADSSEGLVVKNPRSRYRLNERNDDWIKVKPEYMNEYGEELDCIVIGGYFGSGKRGGAFSSYLCGLRVDEHYVQRGADPRKCLSFVKVGGGFTAGDYAAIRHQTEGKWHQWDRNKPPSHLIELGGGDKQYECPDMWIHPDESIVIAVKAASAAGSPQFAFGITLRFPRFKSIRSDKDWKTALSMNGFHELREEVEKQREEKKFVLDDARRKRVSKTRKKALVIAGTEEKLNQELFEPGSSTNVFVGLNFYVMTESLEKGDRKKSRVELESLVKHHGGRIFQSERSADDIICIGDRNLPKVAALKKHKNRNIIRPSWVFDCIQQAERDFMYGRTPLALPCESKHVFYCKEEDDLFFAQAADQWGDGFARDAFDVHGLKEVFDAMPGKFESQHSAAVFSDELEEAGCEFSLLPGWVFKRCVVWFNTFNGIARDGEDAAWKAGAETLASCANIVNFAGGRVAENFEDSEITHIVVPLSQSSRQIRNRLKSRTPMPRLVTTDWIEESWREKTLVDEDRFVPD